MICRHDVNHNPISLITQKSFKGVLMDIIIEKLGEIGVAIIFMLPAIGTFSELLYKTMT